ncbi:AAA family ATPase [Neoroseomonas oryzicola]|uniref:Uncharacterized protein n=1 Tax=Neoroseomonas oryzicola TaxID=535904 RepID=A0A9X9WMY6_9PROT|nr:hypothetical protein [Neoroseomonas oryzicola]MBR0661696.1 hypothetical protein [Neoroseomonas oryzicola]NKE20087.1 hypothetical protein [Neoroseomonas oryzicola]
MTEEYKPIPRTPDRQALKFFEALEETLNFSNSTINLIGSHETIKFPSDDIIEKIIESDGYIVSRITSNKAIHGRTNNGSPVHVSVTFQRGEPKLNSNSRTLIEPSVYVDTIQISGVEHADAAMAFDINQLIQNDLISKSTPLLLPDPGSTLRGVVETHHQLISALESKMLAISDNFTEKRLNFEKEFDNRKKILEEEYYKKTVQLSEDERTLRDAIKNEADALEAQRQALDDRNNTHARREIRQNLKKQLNSYKEHFRLTKQTRSLRWPIHFAVILGVGLSSLGVFWTLSQNIPEGDYWARAIFSVKSAAFSFFAAGLVIWYLKWLTKWSDRHADAEFHLRQLELDIDRASWLVETSFEWKSSQDSPIPNQLLDALSRNLFSDATRSEMPDQSPADHLASTLLGEASRLKLNIGGHEIEVSRNGLKKLSKSE